MTPTITTRRIEPGWYTIYRDGVEYATILGQDPYTRKAEGKWQQFRTWVAEIEGTGEAQRFTNKEAAQTWLTTKIAQNGHAAPPRPEPKRFAISAPVPPPVPNEIAHQYLDYAKEQTLLGELDAIVTDLRHLAGNAHGIRLRIEKAVETYEHS